MKRLLSLAFILVAGGSWGASDKVVVASWNVENLFDTLDDPSNEGDDGFTPHGWMRWTDARYALKLQHLSDIIFQMRPDVLCLTEIENRRVLTDLARTLKERHAYELPVIVHRDGCEKRGIDVAMLANCAPITTNWLLGVSGQREVLVCDFMFSEKPLTVLVNHWKSQLGKKETGDEIRRKEALAVRTYLDKRLFANPAAAILVAGDFNDSLSSPILTEDAGFVPDLKRVRDDKRGRLLFNLAGGLPEETRVTYYYAAGKVWNTMDSMSVTCGMLDQMLFVSPWRVSQGGYSVFKSPEQCSEMGTPLPFRRVRNKEVGDIFITGYSDHFPVRVELERR